MVEGTIIKLGKNTSGKDYGIIKCVDKNTYIFYETSLISNKITDLSIGDRVQFSIFNENKATNVSLIVRGKNAIDKNLVFKNNPLLLIGFYEPFIGETLILKTKNNEVLVGDYNNHNNQQIRLIQGDEIISVNFTDVENFYFFGVISSYILSSMFGLINSKYKFKITSVKSDSLKSAIKSSLHEKHGCIYSLMYDGTNASIIDVNDFSLVSGSLIWQNGTILGVYSEYNYFSVDRKFRCYWSSVYSSTLKKLYKDKDFLEQAVYFKSVKTKNNDEFLEDNLNNLIVDIRPKYNLGKAIINPSANLLSFVSEQEPYKYTSTFKINKSDVMQDVTYEISCINKDNITVINYQKGAHLQSFKTIINDRKAKIKIQIDEAKKIDDFHQQLKLNIQQLENFDVNPRTAINAMFFVSVKLNNFDYFKDALTRFGYLLPKHLYYGYEMKYFFVIDNLQMAKNYALKVLDSKVKPDSEIDQLFKLAWEINSDSIKANEYINSLIKSTTNQQKNIQTIEYAESSTNDTYRHKYFEEKIAKYDLIYFFKKLPEKYKYIKDKFNFEERKFNGSAEDYRNCIDILQIASEDFIRKFFNEYNRIYSLVKLLILFLKINTNKNLETRYQSLLESNYKNLAKLEYSRNEINVSTRHYYADYIFQVEISSQSEFFFNALMRILKEFTNAISHDEIKDIKTEQNFIEFIKNFKFEFDADFIRFLFNLPKITFSYLVSLLHQHNSGILLSLNIGKAFNPSESNNSTKLLADFNFVFDKYERELKQYLEFIYKNFQYLDEVERIFQAMVEYKQGLIDFLYHQDVDFIHEIEYIFKEASEILSGRNIYNKIINLEKLFNRTNSAISNIEQFPTKISIDTFHPILVNFTKMLSSFITKQCLDFVPNIKVKHYSLSQALTSEILSISNSSNLLPALNVKIEAKPHGLNAPFKVDDGENRSIEKQNQNILSDETKEISIPIKFLKDLDEQQIELDVQITYSYYQSFSNKFETATKTINNSIIIPLENIEEIETNPYADFAEGRDLNPENPNENAMFFGREYDMNEIIKLITSGNELKSSIMYAVYGQKRSGKTSFVRFTANRLKKIIPDLIEVWISAEGITSTKDYPDLFFINLIKKIVENFKSKLFSPDYIHIKKTLDEIGLPIPKTLGLSSEEINDLPIQFNGFFRSFRNYFGKKYPILVVIDEFTKVYIKMKEQSISADFLNRYRALIEENLLTNIIIGHDFMKQFFTDSAVIKQNYGNALNGLANLISRRLTYLDVVEARSMMEKPLLTSQNQSRFEGDLGYEAIKRIYDLTGGSVFYLMKFLNLLTQYMMLNKEKMVTLSDIMYVANTFGFESQRGRIEKKEFDPLFNEFSDTETSNSKDQIEILTNSEMQDKTYNLLKLVAIKSNQFSRSCMMEQLQEELMDNTNRKIFKSLLERGVLVDDNGNDIITENLETIASVKIKVGLFHIWLTQRG